MAFCALSGVRRRVVPAVAALDDIVFRFHRVAGLPFVVLVAEVALHVAVAAAFHPILIDRETIIAYQHNKRF